MTTKSAPVSLAAMEPDEEPMAVKQKLPAPAPAESYDDKVARLLARVESDSYGAAPSVVNAEPGWVYRWTPSMDDKSSSATAARGRLISQGYELAPDGQFYANVAGGMCWRIPTPVYEALEAKRSERMSARWRQLGVDPESLEPTVVKRRRNGQEVIETYI